METNTSRIVNTTQLKAGDVVDLKGSHPTIAAIESVDDDWVRIHFDTFYFDSVNETWYQTYLCNAGFCFKVI